MGRRVQLETTFRLFVACNQAAGTVSCHDARCSSSGKNTVDTLMLALSISAVYGILGFVLGGGSVLHEKRIPSGRRGSRRRNEEDYDRMDCPFWSAVEPLKTDVRVYQG